MPSLTRMSLAAHVIWKTKFARRQSGTSSTIRRRTRRCAGLLYLINTGMRDAHDLTDQQWNILAP